MKLWMICIVFLSPTCLWGQKDTLSLSMDQALNIARIFSIDAIVARNTLQIAYWSYRNYKADLLPGMVLDGTAWISHCLLIRKKMVHIRSLQTVCSVKI